MAYYPQDATGLDYITYPAGPTAVPGQVTAPTVDNTKGAYLEYVASSPFACNFVEVQVQQFSGNAATPRRGLIDLATGAAASETVVLPDLLVENNSTGADAYTESQFLAPLGIAISTRIAVRYQMNVVTSANLRLTVALRAAGGVDGITTFTNLGADTSDSGGTQVDPGGSANTKGAYSELDASTAAIYQWLGLMVTAQGVDPATSGFWAIDFATGAAASEVVLIPDTRFCAGTASEVTAPRMIPFLIYLAASTRLAVRASCSQASLMLDVALLVGTAPAEPSGGGGGSYAFA